MTEIETATTETRAHRWRVVVASAGAGLLGLLLGVPVFMAGFHLGPQDDTMRDLALGRTPPPPLLEATARSREAALGWMNDGGPLADLAVLRLRAAAAKPLFSPERRDLLAQGIALQQRSLALRPADGYGWTRLAQALAQAARPPAEIERALAMSLDRAPSIPGLVPARLAVAMLYWRGLSPGLRRRMAGQVRLAALWIPTDLARLARARFLEDQVREALADDARLAARFDYALARLARPPRR